MLYTLNIANTSEQKQITIKWGTFSIKAFSRDGLENNISSDVKSTAKATS